MKGVFPSHDIMARGVGAFLGWRGPGCGLIVAPLGRWMSMGGAVGEGMEQQCGRFSDIVLLGGAGCWGLWVEGGVGCVDRAAVAFWRWVLRSVLGAARRSFCALAPRPIQPPLIMAYV